MQSTETSKNLKGLFSATDWDGSSSALLTFLGLITEAVSVLSMLEVHFVQQTSLTKSLVPVKGKLREAALCPCDAEVFVMLSGVFMLHLLSWLPAG